MSGSIQHQMVVALREDVARLHEHVETKVDQVNSKVDTMAVQYAILDTHVTKIIKEVAESRAQLGTLLNLRSQLLGGVAVIGFVITAIFEIMRIWFH